MTAPPSGDIIADWNAINALIDGLVESLLALPALRDPNSGAYMGLGGERALVELAHEFGEKLGAALIPDKDTDHAR